VAVILAVGRSLASRPWLRNAQGRRDDDLFCRRKFWNAHKN
jgi:hypothetical protein